MNGSSLPLTATAASAVCASAAGARVIRSSGSNSHGHPVSSKVSRTAAAGTLSPRSLRPFGSNHSPRAWWYMRQIWSGEWVEAKRIDPPETRKWEDGNCSVGYRGSDMFFFVGTCLGRVYCVYMWADRRDSILAFYVRRNPSREQNERGYVIRWRVITNIRRPRK